MAFYDKIYKLEKEENYEEFVDAYGLPEEKKNFLLSYKPNQKFVKDGDDYSQVIYLNDVEKSVPFKLGEEFETVVGTTNVKNLYNIEGDTVTVVLKFGVDDEIVVTVKKEFTEDKMVETLTNNLNDLSAKRYYSV